MIDKKSYINKLVQLKAPSVNNASAYAPSNIALCKYWGKKNLELNLPTTPSLSISLRDRGSHAKLSLASQNLLSINGVNALSDSPSFKRTFDFVNLFTSEKLAVHSRNTIPTAAGLASSASYFAALVMALNKIFDWQAPISTLSCLARLGSGSACRSLQHGFVKWFNCDDPWQSYGELMDIQWEELRIGLLIFDAKEKAILSRQAMLHTQKTSPFYQTWCENSRSDFVLLHKAIEQKNFTQMGETAEYNALSLHAVMLAARPAIIYSQPTTLQAVSKVHELRSAGVEVYLTQDAGPNLKLLFLKKDLNAIQAAFAELEVINPFSTVNLIDNGVS
jgi:diphosphomevalonate decarboxylase